MVVDVTGRDENLLRLLYDDLLAWQDGLIALTTFSITDVLILLRDRSPS
jgi:hypothetical protein